MGRELIINMILCSMRKYTITKDQSVTLYMPLIAEQAYAQREMEAEEG